MHQGGDGPPEHAASPSSLGEADTSEDKDQMITGSKHVVTARQSCSAKARSKNSKNASHLDRLKGSDGHVFTVDGTLIMWSRTGQKQWRTRPD
jgi:hypothetical protein